MKTTIYYALGFDSQEEATAAAALLQKHQHGAATLPFEVTLRQDGEVVTQSAQDAADAVRKQVAAAIGISLG